MRLSLEVALAASRLGEGLDGLVRVGQVGEVLDCCFECVGYFSFSLLTMADGVGQLGGLPLVSSKWCAALRGSSVGH